MVEDIIRNKLICTFFLVCLTLLFRLFPSLLLANQESSSGKGVITKEEKVEKDEYNAQRVKEIQEKAEKGDADNQYTLACLYSRGIGVKKDYKLSKMWFEKALQNGSTLAHCSQGVRFFGDGKYKEAFEHFKKASDDGFVEAHYFLAYFYLKPVVVSKDVKKGIYLYEKAANEGHVDSQYSLGNIYLFGHGVKKDLDQAIKWLSMAAEKVDAQAQFELGQAFLYKCAAKEGDDKKSALELAYEWFTEDSNKFRLDDPNIQESLEKAYYWLEQAAKQGVIGAQFMFACLSAAKNENVKAYAWFMVIASQVSEPENDMERIAINDSKKIIIKLKNNMSRDEFDKSSEIFLKIKSSIKKMRSEAE